MYNIKRVDGKYLAIHKDNKSNIYIIPDDVFTKLLRNGVNRNNISDELFTTIMQQYSGIVPYKCFDDLNKEGLGNAKKVLIDSEEGINKLRKRKANGKSVKTNQEKSRKVKEIKVRVAAGVMAVIMALTGGLALVKKLSNRDKNTYTIEKNLDNNHDDTDKHEQNEEEITFNNDNQNNDDALNYYYDEYEVSEESAKNAMQYYDLCKKYGDMYGEDYRMLMGTLAQELNGNHKLKMNTPAVGVSQIEKKEWVNTKIRAYNFETGEYEEYWLIAPNVEDTIDDEEFNKRLKSGDIIEKYGIENVINIETVEGSIKARAMIDAYNAEQSYRNGALKSIPETDLQAYSKARENKGPIVYKTLSYGDEWKEHLDITNNGDDLYVNKVYSFANILSNLCQDYSPYSTKIFDGKNIKTFNVYATSNNRLAKTK